LTIHQYNANDPLDFSFPFLATFAEKDFEAQNTSTTFILHTGSDKNNETKDGILPSKCPCFRLLPNLGKGNSMLCLLIMYK